jgi:hypothetical protein
MPSSTMALIPPYMDTGPMTPAQLQRARLRIAWEMLSQVAEHADLLPLAARPCVGQALAYLVEAKALLEDVRQSRGV